MTEQPPTNSAHRAGPYYLIIVGAALLLAAFLRFYRLGFVPPALNGDEAVFGSGALYLLKNGPSLFIEGQGGGGILASYFVALFFWLLEPGKWALRFQASFFGLVTVILLFFSTRALLRSEPKPYLNWVAALTMLFLAINYNHATISRIAFAIIHLPFLQLWAILFFWLGYHSGKRRYFALAGLALALVLYGYLSGVVTPGIFLAFAVTSIVSSRFWPTPEATSPRQTENMRDGVKLFGLSFMLFVIPLVFFYAANTGVGSSGRLTQASFLNPTINQGDPWGALWHGLSGNYAAFGLAPVFWPVTNQLRFFLSESFIVATFAGIILSLLRIRRKPYQFLLLWWGLTILPAALAPDTVPHTSRAIGVYPPMSVLAALASAQLLFWTGNQWQSLRSQLVQQVPVRWQYLTGFLVGALLLSWGIVSLGQTTWQRFNYYFNEWPYLAETLDAFNLYAVELADDMAALATPQTAFLLPRDTAAGSVSPNGTVNFLHSLNQIPGTYQWLTDDEEALPAALNQAAQEATTIQVIDWKVTKHTGADPKEAFHYYLEKYGQQTELRSYRFYDIRTYSLAEPGQDFTQAEALIDTDVKFADQLVLTGYNYGNAGSGEPQATFISAGEPLWVRLRWQKLADHPEDLKVSLIVKGQNGQRVYFVDKYLQSNLRHERSSQWPLLAIEETYFILPVPPQFMPGPYSLNIRVYGDESLTALASVSGQPDYALGELLLDPAPVIVTELPPEVSWKALGTADNTLSLYLNPDSLPDSVKPGERLYLQVAWQMLDQPAADYSFSVVLQEPDQTPLILTEIEIGGEHYPTSRWRPGETVSQQLPLSIPPGIDGTQTLSFIISANDQQLAQWPVKDLEIAGWEPTYDLPDDLLSLDARLGESIRLSGYTIDIDDSTEEAALHLNLYWQTGQILSEDYVVFVHLLDGNGQIIAQMDQGPGGGDRPTTGWSPDEVIADSYRFPLPPSSDLMDLSLVIGLYTPQDFQRLPVILNGQTDDKVVLPVTKP